MKQFLKDMFSKEDCVSSRRVVGFLAFMTIMVISLVNLVSSLIVTKFIYDGLLWIVFTCFGLTTLSNLTDILVKPSDKHKDEE